MIYKTTPELVTAILRGDVDVGFDYYAAFGPSIVNKQFKVIATSGEQRAPQLPAVPTVKESGYPDFVVTSWNAIQGPAGVPKDIVTKLNEHIVAALKTPEIQARMGDLGIHPMIGSPEFLERAHEERDRQMGESHSGGGRREAIGHDPEKWVPVFGRDHAPQRSVIPKSGNRFSEKITRKQEA